MATCDPDQLLEDGCGFDGLSNRDLEIAKAQLICEIYNEIANPTPGPILWEDLRTSAFSTKLGGSKDPDWVKFKDDGSGSRGVYTFAFDKALVEEVYFAVQLPHGWNEGTNLMFHVHWAPSGTDTSGDVVWCLEYTWASINAVYSDTVVVGIADAPSGVAGTHQMTSAIVIPASGKTASSMIMCRLFRDAASAEGFGTDGYDEDAFMLEADFHYQVIAIGQEI